MRVAVNLPSSHFNDIERKSPCSIVHRWRCLRINLIMRDDWQAGRHLVVCAVPAVASASPLSLSGGAHIGIMCCMNYCSCSEACIRAVECQTSEEAQVAVCVHVLVTSEILFYIISIQVSAHQRSDL
jgi:hypothetical protein